MNTEDMFELMISKDISDLFVRAGGPLRGRIDNKVTLVGEAEITLDQIKNLVEKIPDAQTQEDLQKKRNCEFTLWYKKDWRFRISIFFQRNSPVVVVRKINLKLNSFASLNLPVTILTNLCKEKRGLVLLTGTTGSGKSTTIATMLDYINTNSGYNILTIELVLTSKSTDFLESIR